MVLSSADAPNRTGQWTAGTGYNARRTLHQLHNASTCISWKRPTALRIILWYPPNGKGDRKVLLHFVPVCQLFIKDILYHAESVPYPILLIQDVPYLYLLLSPCCWTIYSWKENTTISTMVKARHKAATKPVSTFYNLLKIFFMLLLISMQRNRPDQAVCD